MECENCKFNDGTFNTAFTGLVLLFTDNPQKALKESHRILKPESSLIIADPDISYLSSFWKAEIFV